MAVRFNYFSGGAPRALLPASFFKTRNAMKTRLVLASLLLFQCLLSCGGSASDSSGSYAEDSPKLESTTEARASGAPQNGGDALPEKKVIRSARLRMEVADYESAVGEAKTLVKQYEAEITAEEERQYGRRVENQLTIRLQPEDLEPLLNDLEKLAVQVDARSVQAEDVTRRYIDLQTRLETKREVIGRYRDLLQEAENVQDILAVENNLRQVIEEVESMEAQFRYLKQQVARSTIELTLYETTSEGIARRSFGSRIAEALSGGWQLLQNMLIGLIEAWPVLLILLALIAWWIRRRQRKR